MIRRIARFLGLLCLTVALASAQASKPAAPADPKAASDDSTISAAHVDLNDMLRETQWVDNRPGKLALFWWVPAEFFEASAVNSGISPGQARRSFAALREYTMMVVAVGDIGGFGGADYLSEAEIRKGVTLRDQAGNTYKALDKVSDDAQMFADLMKPMMKNMLGQMGEGLRFLFFPNKDAMGKEFANPHQRSEFTLVATGLQSTGSITHTFRLPLTSFSPPKFCPVGKERVEANWKYCPWHGNKLDEDPVATAPAPAPKTQ